MPTREEDLDRYADKERRRAYLKAYREDPVNRERNRERMNERYRDDPEFRVRQRAHTEATRAKKIALLRPIVDEAKAAGCALCPETEPACMHFHHKDPGQKSFRIAGYLYDMRPGKDPGFVRHQELLRAEISKCIVLCSNCHMKFHAGLITLPSHL